jgi:tetratricopeptide (TPR) repeat protein
LDRTWPERLVSSGEAVWFYLSKLVWPYPLMTGYPSWQLDTGQMLSWLPLLAVIMALYLLWLKRDLWSRSPFCVFVYFLVALLPVLGFFTNTIFRYSFVFDHFQYLASMGPLALLGAGLSHLPGKLKNPWLPPGLGAGVLLLFGLLTWQHASVFESDETLWTDTVRKNPNCWLAYSNLGEFLQLKGQDDLAMIDYQRALALNPQNTEAHSNLGNLLLKKGKLDEAIGQFQEALSINPQLYNIYFNLGRALGQKGQLNESIEQFKKGLDIYPFVAEAQNDLGVALLQAGEVDDAILHLRAAIKINHGLVEAHHNYACALVKKGAYNKAVSEFQEALQLNPNDATAQKDLANAQAMAEQNPTQE